MNNDKVEFPCQSDPDKRGCFMLGYIWHCPNDLVIDKGKYSSFMQAVFRGNILAVVLDVAAEWRNGKGAIPDGERIIGDHSYGALRLTDGNLIVRDRMEEQKRRRLNQSHGHKDFNVKNPSMWMKKTQTPASHNFQYFTECLQERCDMFQRLTRGLYSKTLIRTMGAPPPHP
jgi:hypothetical protein